MARNNDGSKSVMRYADSHKKSIVKAISWRALASMLIFGSVYYFTGEAVVSFNVTMIDIILKIMLYYFHERAWMQFNF